jgi:hypothetical protein
MYPANKKKPEEQTRAEWLNDHDKARGLQDVTPSTLLNKNTGRNTLLFRYDYHRTTRKGSVVLEFETLDGKLSAVKFFNVNLSSRGNKAYPSGYNGQFNPPPRGKFRKFYKKTTGCEPSRWCRVHKSLRNKLRGKVFIGTIEKQMDSNGDYYFKIIEIELHK